MSMQVIEHIELTSAQSSITFSSIPQTFTDLYLVVSSRTTADPSGANQNIGIRFNGASTSQSTRELYGTGSGTGSASISELRLGYTSSQYATANTFGSSQAYIPNYTSSNYKSFSADGVAEGNITGMFQAIEAGLWSNTAAITSLTVVAANGGKSFEQYTSATLYAITSGQSGTTTVS